MLAGNPGRDPPSTIGMQRPAAGPTELALDLSTADACPSSRSSVGHYRVDGATCDVLGPRRHILGCAWRRATTVRAGVLVSPGARV